MIDDNKKQTIEDKLIKLDRERSDLVAQIDKIDTEELKLKQRLIDDVSKDSDDKKEEYYECDYNAPDQERIMADIQMEMNMHQAPTKEWEIQNEDALEDISCQSEGLSRFHIYRQAIFEDDIYSRDEMEADREERDNEIYGLKDIGYSDKKERISFDEIVIKNCFLTSRSGEIINEKLGYKEESVGLIMDKFYESVLLDNPIHIAKIESNNIKGFNHGDFVLISGHTRLEVFKRAKKKKWLSRPDVDYMIVGHIYDEEDVDAGITDSILTNLAHPPKIERGKTSVDIISDEYIVNMEVYDQQVIKDKIAKSWKGANGIIGLSSGIIKIDNDEVGIQYNEDMDIGLIRVRTHANPMGEPIKPSTLRRTQRWAKENCNLSTAKPSLYGLKSFTLKMWKRGMLPMSAYREISYREAI
jgi:hypothetical protein